MEDSQLTRSYHNHVGLKIKYHNFPNEVIYQYPLFTAQILIIYFILYTFFKKL